MVGIGLMECWIVWPSYIIWGPAHSMTRCVKLQPNMNTQTRKYLQV